MIFVVRHGQTDWNVQRKIQGYMDIPLNAAGRAQALEIREQLSGVSFELVFSSPLSRAVETAETVSGTKNIITDARLIERCNGKLEGLAVDEVHRIKNMTDYDDDRFGVEPIKNIRQRVVSFFGEIKEKYPGKNILVVTHGGVSIYTRCYFEGEPSDGDYNALMLSNCGFLKYDN